MLCGKEKLVSFVVDEMEDVCDCPSSVGCLPCLKDIKARSMSGSSHAVHYSCPIHGQYRHYEDDLVQYKVIAI